MQTIQRRTTRYFSILVVNSSATARRRAHCQPTGPPRMEVQQHQRSTDAPANAPTAQAIPPHVKLMRTVLTTATTRPRALRQAFAPPKKMICAMMPTRLCQGRRTNEPNVVPIQGMCTFLLLSAMFFSTISALPYLTLTFYFPSTCFLCFTVGASRALSESSQRVPAEILVDLLVAAVNPTPAMPMATVQALSVSLVSGLKTCPTVPLWPPTTRPVRIRISVFYRAQQREVEVTLMMKVIIQFAVLILLIRGRPESRQMVSGTVAREVITIPCCMPLDGLGPQLVLTCAFEMRIPIRLGG